MKNKIKTLADAYNFVLDNVQDADISYRGGSLKVDVSDLFETGDEPAVMGAYQNYLGGGIAGAIQAGRMFDISDFTAEDMAVYELLAIMEAGTNTCRRMLQGARPEAMRQIKKWPSRDTSNIINYK